MRTPMFLRTSCAVRDVDLLMVVVRVLVLDWSSSVWSLVKDVKCVQLQYATPVSKSVRQ